MSQWSHAVLLLLLPLLGPGQEPPRPASGPASRPAFPGLPPSPGRTAPAGQGLRGVWEVRRLVFPGAPGGVQHRGYVVFTGEYASFHILLGEPGSDPLFQSGFWRYAVVGGRLRFQSLLGVRSDPRGRLRADARGAVEERFFEFVAGGLRLHRGPGAYLELTRLE